jgi:hypothetical protein
MGLMLSPGTTTLPPDCMPLPELDKLTAAGAPPAVGAASWLAGCLVLPRLSTLELNSITRGFCMVHTSSSMHTTQEWAAVHEDGVACSCSINAANPASMGYDSINAYTH